MSFLSYLKKTCLVSIMTLNLQFSYAQQTKLILPLGHSLPVHFISYSPDGKYLLTASEESRAIVWLARTGKQLFILDGHKGKLTSASFSPDGTQILTTSVDSLAIIWNMLSGEESFRMKHKHGISHGAFHPKNKTFVTVSGPDSSLYFWDSHNGSSLHSFRLQNNPVSVAFNPRGDWLYVNTYSYDSLAETSNSQTFIISSADGKTVDLGYLKGSMPLFDESGTHMFTWESLGIDFWDHKSKKKLAHIEYIGPVQAFAMAHGRIVIGDAYTLTVFDMKGKRIRELKRNQSVISELHQVFLHPSGNIVYTVSPTEALMSYDILSGEVKSIFQFEHYQSFHNTVMSPDGRHLASTDYNKVHLIDIGNSRKQHSLYGRNKPVKLMDYNPINGELISLAPDNRIRVWDTRTGKLRLSIKDSTWCADIASIHFADNYSKIAAIECEGLSSVWEITSGKRIITEETYQADNAAAIYAIAGYNDIYIKLRSNDSTIRQFETGVEIQRCVLSPDGKKVLSTGFFNKGVKLWDVKTGSLIHQFSYENELTGAALFSPDSKFILIARENVMEVYDAESLQLLKSFSDNSSLLGCALFDPQEPDCIFIGSLDGTIKKWRLFEDKPLFTMIALQEEDYLTMIPEGYYLASRTATRLLSYRINNKLFGFDQFDLLYNQPHKVLEAIGNKDSALINLYRKAYEKRLRKYGIRKNETRGSMDIPELQVLNETRMPAKVNQAQLRLKISAYDKSFSLSRYYVFVNGVPQGGYRGSELSSKPGDTIIRDILVELSVGLNAIQISCMNENGAESQRELFFVDYVPLKPVSAKTYFIGIGINHYQDSSMNLRYATKDIADLESIFRINSKNFSGLLFLDEHAVAEKILELKSLLRRTTVNDKVIIAFSGHGILDDSLNFYCSAFATDFRNPRMKSILYEDLEMLLNDIPARQKLLLIDACHSGEADKESLVPQQKNDTAATALSAGTKGAYTTNISLNAAVQNTFELMKEMFSDLSQGNGTIVISASGAKQYALEDSRLNNGIFTYCILNSLKKPENGNRSISVNSLKKEVCEQVEFLTQGLQKPTVRKDVSEFDWYFW